MSESFLKNRLFDLARKVYREQLAYISHLSPAEQNARGTLHKWAAKDELNHSNYWKRRAIERLSYYSRGMPSPDYPPYLECNDANFEEYKETSLPYIQREGENILKSLVQVLDRFSDEEILEKGKLSAENPHCSVFTYILDHFQSHPLWHTSLSYYHKGESAKGIELQDNVLRQQLEITADPLVHGEAYLSRAEYDVETGANSSAIEHLRRAVEISPSLKEVIRNSSTFEVLKDEAGYAELVD